MTGLIPPVGALVQFRQGTPQFPANEGITYRVVPSPTGEDWSMDNTHMPPYGTETEGRPYVWLEDVSDPSLTRTGYASALTQLTIHDVQDSVTLPSGNVLSADTWEAMREAQSWRGFLDPGMYGPEDQAWLDEEVAK